MSVHKRNFLATAIVKAMSVFGGVQVMNIVCSIVRNKIISLLVGSAGVGLVSIFNTATELLSSVTSLGIRNSATQALAANLSEDDREKTVSVVRRWAWIVGVLGFVVTLLLSPFLSYVAFDTYSKWWCFAVLSVAVLINALTVGELSVLQGTFRLSALAGGSIAGNLLGLAAVFPLIYFMGEAGILPMIFAYYLLTGIAVWWVGRRKESACVVRVNRSETIERGKGLLKLGFMLTLSMSIAYLFNYLFLMYLNYVGNKEIVGLFQAGSMLERRYADLVFAAMAVEYFPRLSSVAFSRHRLGLFVSQQIHVTLAVIIPAVALFIPLRDIAIRLLYTSEFLVVSDYVAIAAAGTVWRAVSWCMSFAILAKGDGKMYLVTESVSAVIGFVLYVAGYRVGGFEGIGVGYVVWYIIYTLIIGCVFSYRYGLRFNRNTYSIIALAVVITMTSLYFALRDSIIGVCVVAIIAVAVGCVLFTRVMRKK